MGRFASTVKFYARYREPYPPEFFKKLHSRSPYAATKPYSTLAVAPACLPSASPLLSGAVRGSIQKLA